MVNLPASHVSFPGSIDSGKRNSLRKPSLHLNEVCLLLSSSKRTFGKGNPEGRNPKPCPYQWIILVSMGQLGVPLTVYSWYLLCSLRILGDYNPYIPTTHNIGLIEGFSIGVRCRGTSNYPLMVPVIGGRIKL